MPAAVLYAERQVGRMDFSKRDTTVIKGVAISLMLWHHLFTFPERLIEVSYISLPFINGETLAMATGQFGKICVAMFALLSGYGTYLSGKKSDKDRLIRQHLLRMYKSFWKVFLIAVPVSWLIGSARPDPFLEDFIYGALGLRFSYCNEWWFITPLAVLLICSPFIHHFIDRRQGRFITDAMWIVLLNGFVYYLLPQITEKGVLAKLDASFFWLELYTTLTLLPAYAAGCSLARHDVFSKIKTVCAGKAVWAMAALAVIAGLFLIHPFNWLLYDFINAAVFICCLIILFETKAGRLVSGVFEALGKESTFMWLTHALFCYYWCQKLVYLPRYAPLIFLWLLVLSFASAKALGLFWNGMGKIYSRLSEIKL